MAVKPFRVCPSGLCHAPGRTFLDAPAALQFAREAADRFRVVYVVWQRQNAAYRVLTRVEPGRA